MPVVSVGRDKLFDALGQTYSKLTERHSVCMCLSTVQPLAHSLRVSEVAPAVVMLITSV